jgi:hypothetical protein
MTNHRFMLPRDVSKGTGCQLKVYDAPVTCFVCFGRVDSHACLPSTKAFQTRSGTAGLHKKTADAKNI